MLDVMGTQASSAAHGTGAVPWPAEADAALTGPPPIGGESDILALVQCAQNGDTDAFGKIYDHFFAQVYRYSAFRLPPEVAEDTVADIFVKAWEKLYQYKAHRNVPFAAWLFRIARHTVIDVYRTQRGFEEVPESLEDPDIFNRAETAVERKDLLRMVRKAVSLLPRRYREVLLLVYVGNLSHGEAARVLHLTEGAVRILKLRALRKLEASLPSECRELL
jgi:RNA polymerase sigma-70 factor (ECF subfamily)